MSQSLNAARIFSRIGFILPLLLTLLGAADAAYACPQHSGKAAYRTKTIKTRTASYAPMATTVITYRAPISYRRCGNTLTDTRGMKYVAAGGDRHYASRRMVVRDSYDDYGYYQPRRSTRYVAVRDLDRYESPRYVAVRRRPVYVDEGVRYVAVRKVVPREKLVPVSEIADVYDDDIQYVKSSRHSGTRYVAVRDEVDRYEVPRTKYVAVRDEIKEDDNDRGNVVYRSEVEKAGFDSVDDDVYINGNGRRIRLTSSMNSDAYRHETDGTAYLTTDEVESADVRQVAVRTYPETYRTGTISYAPVKYYDDGNDDQAFVDGGGATYIAADDIEDACSRPVAVYEEPEYVSMTRTVSYVPTDDVDDYAFHGGSAGTFVEVRRPLSTVAYEPAGREVYTDAHAAYVAEDDGMQTASYAAVDDTDSMDAEPVTYVAADEAEDMDTRAVSYVPAARTNTHSVSYVPVNSYQDVETTYVTADENCPMDVSYVEAEPVAYVEAVPVAYVAEPPTAVVVEEVGSSFSAISPAAVKIAQTLGYNEGYEDGLDDAQDGDDPEPSDIGAQGYKREYGDKDVYRGAFRSAYLEGYDAGFKSLTPAL